MGILITPKEVKLYFVFIRVFVCTLFMERSPTDSGNDSTQDPLLCEYLLSYAPQTTSALYQPSQRA
jgi:hypothetical protein